ncbi:Glucose 1-dehydrogenase 2 [compost metagenome]
MEEFNFNNELSDKIALVTGGTKGAGKAIAERLLSAGATVIISARNSPQEQNEQLHFIGADLSTADGTQKVVEEILQKFGHSNQQHGQFRNPRRWIFGLDRCTMGGDHQRKPACAGSFGQGIFATNDRPGKWGHHPHRQYTGQTAFVRFNLALRSSKGWINQLQ